jgi:diacylglycerol kinase family enzyme
MHDVIRIEHGDSAGGNNIRYALINVSVGVVAEANGIYNSRYKAIQLLRRFSCEAAIAAAALAAVFTYRNMRCTLSNENGRMRENSLTNLGIIKNPHFAGSLCYDTPVNSSDGKLRVNLCAGLSLSKRIGMLVSLYGHRFSGLPGTMSWLTEELTIESHQEFALEMDGEIVQARKARISVIPRAVRCCQ